MEDQKTVLRGLTYAFAAIVVVGNALRLTSPNDANAFGDSGPDVGNVDKDSNSPLLSTDRDFILVESPEATVKATVSHTGAKSSSKSNFNAASQVNIDKALAQAADMGINTDALRRTHHDLVQALVTINELQNRPQIAKDWPDIHPTTFGHLDNGRWHAAIHEAEDSTWFRNHPAEVRAFQRAIDAHAQRLGVAAFPYDLSDDAPSLAQQVRQAQTQAQPAPRQAQPVSQQRQAEQTPQRRATGTLEVPAFIQTALAEAEKSTEITNAINEATRRILEANPGNPISHQNLRNLLTIYAYNECGFNPRPPRNSSGEIVSSADGLMQILDGTAADWRRWYGDKYNIRSTHAIQHDLVTSCIMAGENALSEGVELAGELGRPVNPVDLYLLHLRGNTGARAFLERLEARPNALAVNCTGVRIDDRGDPILVGYSPNNNFLPKSVIRGNFNIFFERVNGQYQSRTMQEVYDFLAEDKNFSTEPIINAPGNQQSRTPDTQDIPVASGTRGITGHKPPAIS